MNGLPRRLKLVADPLQVLEAWMGELQEQSACV